MLVIVDNRETTMSEDRSKLIIINSTNRVLGTPSDFTVTFHDGCIHAAKNETLNMVVIDACINRSWYTVSTSNNSFVLLNQLGVSVTYYIPVGFYDVNSLKGVLIGMLGTDWSITYNPIINCYTYAYNNISTMNVYSFVFSSNRCGELMGFGPYAGTNGPMSYAASLQSPFPIKINKENSVLIHCDVPKAPCATLDNCSSRIFAESDVILKICNSCAPYDNMTYQSQGNDTFSSDLAVSDITSLRFYITDENNSPLLVNFDWTITLKIIFFKGDEEELLKVASQMRDYLNLIVLDKHMNK